MISKIHPRVITLLFFAAIFLIACSNENNQAGNSSQSSANNNSSTSVKIPSSPGRIPSDVVSQVTFLGGGGDGSCAHYCANGTFGGNTFTLTKFQPNQSLRLIVYEDPSGKFITEWNVTTDSNGTKEIRLENGDTSNYGIVILDRDTGKKLHLTRNMLEY